MSMNNVNSYNVNNYCACTGGTPEYVIKLNQQGPPGPQGEQGLQGPQGVSPEISVYQDTDDTYILQVITATTSFMTPNLMTNANNQINALEEKLQAEIDTKANQSWVEEQLEGFISDLPVATASTLGAVKVQDDYSSIDVTTYPQVLIGTTPSNADTYQKLFVDNTLLTGGVTVVDTSGSGSTSRNIKKAYLALNTTAEDMTLQGIKYEFIHQGYDPLLKVWVTVGHSTYTTPIQATTSRLGFVKPDGTTITITEDGTISAVGGGGGGNIINDDVPSATTTYSSDKIDELNGAQNNEITALRGTVTTLQSLVIELQSRVAALEANINGGNA